MGKQKAPKKEERRQVTGLERLGLRVSMMINSPRAQLERCVTVYRLDTDEEGDWEAVLELLAEQDGLAMTFNDDGSVTLRWDLPTDEDQKLEEGEVVLVESPF
jgi:hypothetical protein